MSVEAILSSKRGVSLPLSIATALVVPLIILKYVYREHDTANQSEMAAALALFWACGFAFTWSIVTTRGSNNPRAALVFSLLLSSILLFASTLVYLWVLGKLFPYFFGFSDVPDA